MSYLKIRRLTLRKRVSGFFIRKPAAGKAILNNVTFSVEKGAVFGITGPNGCGKSTLLKTVLGLLQPQEGNITKNGTDMIPLMPFDRKMAMVFQEFALYPNLSSKQNIAYPMYRRGQLKISPEVAPDTDVMRIASMLEVDHRKLLERMPKNTSLGERQRIAIGKAVAANPEILLMDEPFSNIEENLRDAIRRRLKKFFAKNNTTALIATNNPAELAEMSGDIAVMNEGEIEQIGLYADLYREPLTVFVSQFIGNIRSNLVPAEDMRKMTDGKIPFIMTIRPEDCALENTGNSLEFSGKIVIVQNDFSSGKKTAFIETGGTKDLFGVTADIRKDFKKGGRITIFAPLSRGKFFDQLGDGKTKRIYNL